ENDAKELGCAVDSMLTRANPAKPDTPEHAIKPTVRYHQTGTPRLSARVSFSSIEENSGRKRCVTASVIKADTMPTASVTHTSDRGVPRSAPNSVAGGTPAMPLDPPVKSGVSKITSCRISFVINVMNTK